MAAKKAERKAAAGEDVSESVVAVAELEIGTKKKEKSKDSKLAKKAALKGAVEEVQESADSGGGLQKVDEGTLKFAVCTGVLASRKDSKDIKVQSFSISLFGKQLFEDQTLELTYGHRYGLIAQNGAGVLPAACHPQFTAHRPPAAPPTSPDFAVHRPPPAARRPLCPTTNCANRTTRAVWRPNPSLPRGMQDNLLPRQAVPP